MYGNVFFAIMAISTILLIVYALISCIRLKNKVKWVWIILVFLGIGQISINWTTGDVSFHLVIISLRLFGVSAIKAGPDGPWILTSFIPVGAILFLVARDRIKRTDVKKQAEKQNT